MNGVVSHATCQKVLKAFLSNHASCQLEKQLVKLARQSSPCWWKKRGATTSHSQDLRAYAQTDKQIHTQNTRMNVIDTNNCSATGHLPFVVWGGIRATTGELWPRNCLQGHLAFSFADFWGFSSLQATPRLLKTCITGCDGIARNQLWAAGRIGIVQFRFQV